MSGRKGKRSGGNQSASKSSRRPLTQDAPTIARARQVSIIQLYVDLVQVERLEALRMRLIRQAVDRFFSSNNPHK